MRRARIVCTIGPSSSDEVTLRKLVSAGMDVARLNFSHGRYDEHEAVYQRLRNISDDAGRPVAILQDLQGPKIRVGLMRDGQVTLRDGQTFLFVNEEIEGDDTRASVTYKHLPSDVMPGEQILLDDGLLRVEVVRTGPDWVETIVRVGGPLRNKKGMNLPTTRISQPSLTPKDRADLEFGCKLGVDYVALSFVRSGLDIHQVRSLIPAGVRPPEIIAKIEKPQAVDNLVEIVAAADGIMIARGDLGVEMAPERVPIIQKSAIQLANELGKVTITATQMLESMTVNPRPTRAEASDVANAVLDGTDAVMLSAETASGRYPVEAVEMMDRIIREAERSPFRMKPLSHPTRSVPITAISSAIARAATLAAEEIPVKAIACFTVGGASARQLKSLRSSRDILAFTPSKDTWRRLALCWGVTAFLCEMSTETDALISIVERTMRSRSIAVPGDTILLVMGVPVGKGVPTNMIKLHTVGSSE